MQAVCRESVTIHIVDDDDAVRAGISLLVRARGWTPRAYESASEFLRQHEDVETGCLVLDLQMPDLGGVELVEAMRAIARELPIIVMSALREHERLDGLRRAGVHSVLVKPLRHYELVTAIERAIEQAP